VNSHLNLPEINQETALSLTKFFIQSGQNIFLFGKSGTGKTDISIQAAQQCGYKINYLNLSVLERPDLLGYPKLNDPGDVITYKSPNFLPRLAFNAKPDSIILFDEIDKVPPEITAPLLEILLNKKLNGQPLNVAACVLTGNLSSERAFSNELSSALLDRGAKYILGFDTNIWIDWAKANDVHDLIIGFIKSNPEFACKDNDHNQYASPSPRGWTLASRSIIQAKQLKITDIESISQIVGGYVGNEAGMCFRLWYEYYRQFEPFIVALIEKGNMSFSFSDLMPTEKLVFTIATCSHAKMKLLGDKSKKRFMYLDRLCKFFEDYQVESETQLLGLHSSFSFEQITKHKLYECQKFFELFTRLSEKVSFSK
jgi:AAA domain (dynein-related subfamily)